MSLPPDVSAARALDRLPDPVVLADRDAVLLWANEEAERLFGWDLEEKRGTSCLDLTHPDDANAVLLSLASVQHKELGTAIEVRVRTASGSYRLVEMRGRPALDDPEIGGILLVLRDLTDRRRWELARGNAAAFQTLLQYSTAITLIVDADLRIRSGAAAVPRQLGHDLADVEGRPFHWLVDPRDVERVRDQLAAALAGTRTLAFEARLRHVDGSAVPYSLDVINLLDDPVIDGLVVTGHDISELARAREELSHLATHDSLTGLPNRALFSDRLEHARALARRSRSPLGLIFVDLDGFKVINDRWGHVAGDEVLVEVAKRLVGSVRASDTVARLGGDEFVVLVEAVADEEVAELAERVEQAFTEPFTVRAGSAELSASVGWTVGDADDDERSLVARADREMYRRKQRGAV